MNFVVGGSRFEDDGEIWYVIVVDGDGDRGGDGVGV